MKKALGILVIALTIPLAASALDVGSAAINIVNRTSATAQSGGNHVGSGGSVTTGSQTASVETHTVIEGNDNGTHSETTVTTNVNGDEESHTYTSDGTSSAPIDIEISTTSQSSEGSTSVEAFVHTEINSGDATDTDYHPYIPKKTAHHIEVSVTASSTATTSIETHADILNGMHFGSLHLDDFFSRFFSHIFSVFSSWN